MITCADRTPRRVRHTALGALLVLGASCAGDRDPTGAALPVLDPAPAAMAQTASADITFVAAVSSQATGNSLAFARPAVTQPGDLLLVQVVTSGSADIRQAPAGWVPVRADRTGEHSSVYIFWKRVGPSEPASYSWSLSESTRSAGGLAVYRNVAGSGDPIEAHAAQHNDASTAIHAPSIAVASDGVYLVALFSASSEPRETTLGFLPPQGMTLRYDISSQARGNHRNVVAMHASAPASGTGQTGARTATLNAPRPGWGQLLALRPSGGSGGGGPPVAKAGGPYAGDEGAAIVFDGSASTGTGGARTYAWQFGDGSSGSGERPSHTYADDGTYRAVLTVSDAHGTSAPDTVTVTIANVAPTVTLALSATTIQVGQAVSAAGGFGDPGADAPWQWEIDWGDGTKQGGSASAPGALPLGSRSYAGAGAYTVRLSVRDKDGASGSAQQTLTVQSGPPPGDVWYTDFGAYAVNQRPAGWSEPYGGSAYRVVELAGSTGGRVLQNAITTTGHHALAWDAAGEPLNVELETRARVVADHNESLALLARGAAGRNYYSSRLDSGINQWVIARYVNGASQHIASLPNPFPAGTWVRHRFRVEGGTLQAKVWQDGTPEPAAWTHAGSDASPLPAGFVGVWLRRAPTTNHFDWLRVTRLPGNAPAGPAVDWVWSGGQRADGAMVRVRLTGPSPNVRLRISTDSLFTTYTETATSATAGNHVATFQLAGLAANTRYHYRAVVDAAEFAGRQGAFRTFPVAGSPASFSFALGSCQHTDTNKAVFDHIRATAPLFWMQTGDIHYRNIAVDDVNLFRHAYNQLHQQSRQAALFRSTPIVHVWDDHDGAGGNDTDATKPGWPAAKAAYRESMPHHALVEGAGGAIHHSFVVGRVRFIISDLRSARSPKGNTDNASKTMFGAAQKAHFKAELAAAKAAGQFVAWLTTIPWIASPEAGADHWGGYDTERREIAEYIASLGIGPQMFAISGDMHATAIDSGANNAWGGFAIFNAAPIDQSASTKGGPYTHGPFTNGTAGEQFGVVTISDVGGSTLQVTFSGRRNGAEIPGASHQFTLRLN